MVGRFIMAVLVVASGLCAWAGQQDPLPSDVQRAVGVAPVNPPSPNTESVSMPTEPDQLAGPETVEARRARARQRYENVAQHLPEAHAAWEQRITESLKRAEQLLEELRRTQQELRSASPIRRSEYTTPIQPAVDRGVTGSREKQSAEQTPVGVDAKDAARPVTPPSASRLPASDEPIGERVAAPPSNPTDLAERCEQLAAQLLNVAAQLRANSTRTGNAPARTAPPGK